MGVSIALECGASTSTESVFINANHTMNPGQFARVLLCSSWSSTAKTLGIQIPQTVMSRADEVIE
jgi:hypothetical protein